MCSFYCVFVSWSATAAVRNFSDDVKQENTKRWSHWNAGHDGGGAVQMQSRCMCCVTAWVHFNHRLLWLVAVPAGRASESTHRDGTTIFSLAQGSFVTISVVRLSLRDQTLGWLILTPDSWDALPKNLFPICDSARKVPTVCGTCP